MAEFRSWQSYWHFQNVVKNHNRYIRNSEVEEFLQLIASTSKCRQRSIPNGTILARAQLGHNWIPIYQEDEHIVDEPGPLQPERMKPLANMATEGRVNSKGIPCLYLSNYKETAMAEVRPGVGSLITIAQFRVLKELNIIDCSINQKGSSMFYLEEPAADKKEQAVWLDIDRAFAKPITLNDMTAEYVPTQIISELFKSKGFDGIAYKSSLGAGINIALFDLDLAELINCTLYKAETVSFSFVQTSNTHFIKKD